MNAKSPWQVAEAVCKAMGGSTPDRILAPQRGSPRTAHLRAVSMLVWGSLQTTSSYTAIGRAFGRDRRNVARGLARVVDIVRPATLKSIQDSLR